MVQQAALEPLDVGALAVEFGLELRELGGEALESDQPRIVLVAERDAGGAQLGLG